MTDSMDERNGFIWMNGTFVPWKDAKIHVLTHTLHYGMGVFEGIRCYEISTGGAVFRLKDHIDRLFKSAKIFEIEIPYDENVIFDAVIESIKKNSLYSCYIRTLVFYGPEKMGLSTKGCTVNVMVASWHWGTYLGEEGLSK